MAGWTYATLTTAIGNYTEVGTGVLTATITNQFIENAEFRIHKNLKLKNKNLKYFTSDSQGNILNRSKNLKELLNKTRWKNLKLVN